MESLNIGMDQPLKRRRLSELPAIEYPEDRLIESFHARNPEVLSTPFYMLLCAPIRRNWQLPISVAQRQGTRMCR